MSGTGDFVINNGILTRYTGNDGTVVIPDSVTEIADWVFWRRMAIIEVVFPETLVKIGNRAFFECRGLKSIAIPDSVESIGESAFSYCTELKSIKLPARLEKIPTECFSHCENLGELVVPGGVRQICRGAFMYCTKLAGTVLPESVIKIGHSAFSSCADAFMLTILGTVEMPDFGGYRKPITIKAAKMPISDFAETNGIIAAAKGFGIIYAEDEAQPESVRKSYLCYLRDHREVFFNAAIESTMLLRCMTEEKMLTLEDTDILLNRDELDIEPRVLLLNYRNSCLKKNDALAFLEIEAF